MRASCRLTFPMRYLNLPSRPLLAAYCIASIRVAQLAPSATPATFAAGPAPINHGLSCKHYWRINFVRAPK